ncbi:MAG: hypothetical protein AAF549_00830 [Pseudomonadota bacterium]
MSKKLKAFPKLQTERIFPSQEFKNASRSMAAGSYMFCKVVLPKDRFNKAIIAGGLSFYAVDIWTFLPIGEIALASAYALTRARNRFFPSQESKDYKNEVLQEAIQRLRTPQGPS